MNTETMKNHKKLLIIISTVVLLSIIIVCACMLFKPRYRSVKLEEYNGTVALTRQDKDVEPYKGIMLKPLDTVETMQDSFASLNVDNDKHLGVEENTKLSINATGNENSGKVTIHLEYGSTLITIDEKLPVDSDFEVETPNAICGVRGTTFKVTYDKDDLSTRVDVTEGIVNVKACDISIDVNAGESVVIKDDQVYTVKKENGTETLIPYSQDGSNGGEDGVSSDLTDQEEIWDENRAWTDRDDILPREENGYIVFGAYEQDGDLTNGPEPIEWEVFNSDSNGTLLVSRYVIDAKPYNEVQSKDITWETCTLRKWLNDDFMNKAFTVGEQGCIRSASISTPANRNNSRPAGITTTDQIFILSADEMLDHYSFEEVDNNYLHAFGPATVTPPTEYAKNNGVNWTHFDETTINEGEISEKSYRFDLIGREGAWWWLRSVGSSRGHACIVGANGGMGFNCDRKVELAIIGVRPALYIEQ